MYKHCVCCHRKLRVVVIQIFCWWPWLRDVTLSCIKDDDVNMRSPGRNPDSGIREIFVCRIRNPRKFCLWNLESWVCGIPNTYQGIRNPTNDLNPDSKFLFQRLQSIYKDVEKLGKFGGGGRVGGDRQGHHPGIADYIWFIPLLSLVYQRAQSYYRGMKAHIN